LILLNSYAVWKINFTPMESTEGTAAKLGPHVSDFVSKQTPLEVRLSWKGEGGEKDEVQGGDEVRQGAMEKPR
jgi:hypothetical protein